MVNGQFPGPLLSGNINDNFQVEVIDQLTDDTMLRATSVVSNTVLLKNSVFANPTMQHWHGLFQAHTPEMDGPTFVYACLDSIHSKITGLTLF